MDVWVDVTPENTSRVMRALSAFGAPLGEIAVADFERAGVTYQLCVPPGRIDILTELTGLTFAEAWADRLAMWRWTSSDALRSSATSARPGVPRTSAI